MIKDYFQHKADTYDSNKSRVANVDNIANAIIRRLPFDKAMHVMDFGSGTGLLLERIAPLVDKITAVDISASMNQQLEEKSHSLACKLEILPIDLSQSTIDMWFDGIISSMTLHHIDDIEHMFDRLYSLLKDDGLLAIADLDLEDGSFHAEDTGVFHFGFKRETLVAIAEKSGFKNIHIESASRLEKPQGCYSVFLLTATK
ncbi:MAG: class I SAM-dependent DNA methyltransferase [Cellvibrionaceae bacterium]